MQIDRSESSQIWAPDLFVVNTADLETWSSTMGTMETARIFDANFSAIHGFNVAWKTTITVKSICDFDFARFPFDEQVCSGIIAPLAHGTRYVRLYPRRFPLTNETFADSDWTGERSTFMFQAHGSSTDLGILDWLNTFHNPAGQGTTQPSRNVLISILHTHSSSAGY
eukprot:Gregarina_sp_Poly_1__8068@NODE_463_length_8191_cov_61_524372_g377_i0_p6_GENE_NODE_463_length_8191_cov_61_524372_g377_i0NODE_463_length_8191_cov_61_524372_g377_i0_p6_ORF_typecomplete_len168_score11_42Neur_chan_LBD/PF02931_23/1_3e13_NODE_463_length_8191_cov_61_524372_g377_i010951598